VLHFDFTDFEARENNIYSVEVTASRDTGETTTKTITVTVTDLDNKKAGILVIGNSNKTIGVGVGADLNIGRSFIV
jgi:hypothetical protein